MNHLLIVGLIVLVVLIAIRLVLIAQRLDRLHIRTDAARLKLEAALEQRAAVACVLKPDLKMHAEQVRAIGIEGQACADRARAEAEFSRLVHDAGIAEHPQIMEADTRIELATRFYNNAVTATRALRLQPTVRVLHLSGSARLPVYFDFAQLP